MMDELRLGGVALRILENGYEAEGRAGRLYFENVMPTDEAVYLEGIGNINVSKAWRLVPPSAKPIRIPIDQNLRDHIRLRELDEATLARMTPKRRNEPVLFVMHEGRAQLIDGAHRLHARVAHGLKFAKGFILIPKAIEHCRIKVWKIDGETRTQLKLDPISGTMTA